MADAQLTLRQLPRHIVCGCGMLPSQGCMEGDKVLIIGGSSNTVNQVSRCRRAPPKGCELFTRDGDDNRIREDSLDVDNMSL